MLDLPSHIGHSTVKRQLGWMCKLVVLDTWVVLSGSGYHAGLQ